MFIYFEELGYPRPPPNSRGLYEKERGIKRARKTCVIDGPMTKTHTKKHLHPAFSAACRLPKPRPSSPPAVVASATFGRVIKQAYSMILASSPSKKVNISFSDPAFREPLANLPGGNFIRRGSGGAVRGGKSPGNIKGMSISTRGPRLITPASAPASNQQHPGGNHRSDPPSTSPTQHRVRSLSSASSLSRGRTAPLRAVCQYRRAASLGAVSK